MRAYYGTCWHARGDHSPSATAPQQPLRSLLFECAPNELEQLGSHSRALSRSRLSRDASLFLSEAFFFCVSLCWLSLCCARCRLSLRLLRLLLIFNSFSVRRSQEVHLLPHWRNLQDSTATSLRFASPLQAPSFFCAFSASFTSELCKLQKFLTK